MFKGKKKKQPTPGSKHTGNVSRTRVKANQERVWLCAGGETGLKVGGADLSCLENDRFTFQKCPCLFSICKILIRKESSEGKCFVCRLVLGGDRWGGGRAL